MRVWCFGHVCSVAASGPWSPLAFPAPTGGNGIAACGLQNGPGLLCDPDCLLTSEQRETVASVLVGMQNSVRVPCGESIAGVQVS